MNYTGLAQYVHAFERPAANEHAIIEKVDAQVNIPHISESTLVKSMFSLNSSFVEVYVLNLTIIPLR